MVLIVIVFYDRSKISGDIELSQDMKKISSSKGGFALANQVFLSLIFQLKII
jgi:hypothetical protein